MMLDLLGLKDQIAQGADPDLYRGIRSLDPRIPVSPEISALFIHTARSVIKLYPSRVKSQCKNSYDARVIVIDFCEHPETTRNDIIRVLEDSIVWISSEGFAT